MDLALRDLKLIRAVFYFANLEEADWFAGAHFHEVFRKFGGEEYDFLEYYLEFKVPDEFANFVAIKAELVGWLDRITNFKKLKAREKRELENEVAARLGNVETRGEMSFSEGRIRRDLEYRLSSVEACCAYAIALLLDEKNGLINRVGKCKECGTYWVDFPKGRARPRVQFCSPKHASKYRQKEWRKAQAKKKAKA